MDWLQLKAYLAQVTGLSQDALHIFVALLIQLLAALLLRRPVSHPLPLLVVAAMLAVNEAIDLAVPGMSAEYWRLAGGVRDIWNTLLLPTALMLLFRLAPWVVTGREADETVPGGAPAIGEGEPNT